MEYEIAELMTHRNPSVIVMDFIPNVSASMLNERIERFMSIIEDKIPGVQILFIEHIPFPLAEFNLKKGEWWKRVMRHYEKHLGVKEERLSESALFKIGTFIGRGWREYG